jgi:hypothetical protein
MSKLLKMANERFDASEHEMLEAEEAIVDGLFQEHMVQFLSAITPLLKEELRLTAIYRNDQAPAIFRMYDRKIKEEMAPGTLVCGGEFHYERAADGKTYVFPLVLILTKENGYSKLHFWTYNSYTGLREDVLQLENLEEQISNILLERSCRVDLQFKAKEKEKGTPWRTTAKLVAFSCWTAMIVGVVMAFNHDPNGMTIAKVGFFGQFSALPLSVLASFLEPKQ